MIRVKLYFKLGGHEKQCIKIGASVEDCWDKLIRQYRKSQHIPMIINHEILEKWEINIDDYPNPNNSYERECNKIRSELTNEPTEEYSDEVWRRYALRRGIKL